MPIRLAFEEKRTIDPWVVAIDTIVDMLYIFDCILTFFIPLLTDDGIYPHIY